MTDPIPDSPTAASPPPRTVRRWLLTGLWLAVVIAAGWVALLARQVVIDAQPPDADLTRSHRSASERPMLTPPAMDLESSDQYISLDHWLAGSIPGEPRNRTPADLQLPDHAEPLFNRRFQHGSVTEDVMVLAFPRTDLPTAAEHLTEAARRAGFQPSPADPPRASDQTWSARFTDARQRDLQLRLRIAEVPPTLRAVIRLTN